MIISITTQQLKWQWVVGWVVNYDRRIGIEGVSWGEGMGGGGDL
jgi:hypothetical protein